MLKSRRVRIKSHRLKVRRLFWGNLKTKKWETQKCQTQEYFERCKMLNPLRQCLHFVWGIYFISSCFYSFIFFFVGWFFPCSF